jgi:protein-S-isoprenylcysteine O-methyltransferase Ste14
MKPYFDTNHITAIILLILAMAWGSMELSKTSNRREDQAVRVGGGGRQFPIFPTMLLATGLLWLAPRLVPAAAIRPGAVACVAGIIIVLGGLVLRGWSILTLGSYFTGSVMVSADQPVIATGPYKLLRHPSYTGLLLACAGFGLTAANWVSLAAMVALPLSVLLWRIRAEERALAATLGDRYAAYAARHKRLIPLVW